MSWSDHQRRMLAELGLPPWLAPGTPAAQDVAAGAVAEAEAEAVVAEAAPRVADRRQAAPPGPAAVPARAAAVVVDPSRPAGSPSRGAAGADADAGAATASPRPAEVESAMGTLQPPRLARSDIADLDWDSLRAEVAACTACGLCQGRTQTVFGVGNVQAHWMIVGEAPGEQEDRLGEPFVGRSGQLLDSMLRTLALTRGEAPPERQVYIANTLKCRPPGNRNPTPEELLTCEPFLIRQLALVQPRIILAMGRFAVQALLRSNEPIGRLRGRVHQYQGVPLIVTYHPAYLLRNPQDKARSWDDLCLAAEIVGPPVAPLLPPGGAAWRTGGAGSAGVA